MEILINPGTEKCNGATEKNAIENIKHLLLDCGLECNYMRVQDKDYGKGRYCFIVWKENVCTEIQMPGLELSEVRYMSDNQNIFEFPRLYVDDSSWIWSIAIDVIKDIFEDKEEK